MATPYVAGSVALYLQAKGKGADIQLVKELFQNTARPTTEVGNDKRISSVARQGAGMLNAERAIFGTTHVSPSRLSLNDTANDRSARHTRPISQTITITNRGPARRTYVLSHMPAVSVRGIGANGVALLEPEMRDASAEVQFQSERIEVAAGKSQMVRIRITPPASLSASEHWVYSGYIVAKPETIGRKRDARSLDEKAERAAKDEKHRDHVSDVDTVHVPYLGVKGRLQDLHVISSSYSPPMLINLRTREIIGSRDQTATYTVVDNDYPVVAFRAEFPTRRLRTRIYNAETGQAVGQIPGSANDWLGRNDESENNKLSFFVWKGDKATFEDQQRIELLENGRYYFDLTALRPFGNANNPRDYDVWRSPTITFKRPTNAPVAESSP
ncbi:hypothetical protein THASP1DRAFT_26173 [Thamnocephalis sphaerospora]|uniref:C5a peptidase/Subtilisin-like protease SBT2-like Fn3-like domain-containing protein n=1 Tax=Thamnocephalis sphaerospora TaxID=78915 RepID=A0A4P9XHX0_9FUNG|nr:hypothetical protein THASP1DRAFT_26173 [Thamnocephalis sphaerospora]|eukprot:RKP05303.1 hypothetical protein THASP1DRAFT_26173 [Thamnocephalis sphaerospora]